MNYFIKYKSKITLGSSAPGYRFKPGECIVDKNLAEDYRQGRVGLDKFDEVKLLVLECIIDPKTNVDSYHLLYNSPLLDGEKVPWGEIDPWFTKAYVDTNFDPCEHPEP
jgi:hypothetical protein